jgi:CubicO group peptidase (beta-lactamase class C family)
MIRRSTISQLLSRLLVMALAINSLLAVKGLSAADEGEAWPDRDWQVASPESQHVSAKGLSKVRQWHKDSGSKAGLVIRHGQIVAEWYFDDAKPTEPLLVYSVTKSVCSTAVGMAIAKGKLALDTPLAKLSLNLRPEDKKLITVEQLLSMTSGVHNNKKLEKAPDQFHYAMFEAPVDFSAGEKWDYNNTGLSLLSPLFQVATDQRIDQFVAARIFKPIGVRATEWSWDYNADLPLPYSGLHITPRALARFGLLVLRNGRWKDKQIVPADWLARAVKPSQELEKSYGYLWWNNTAGKWPGVPADAFAALGKFENDMLIVPSLDLIVIRLVGDETGHEHKVRIDRLFRLAVEACDDKPAKEPPATPEDSPEDS